MLDDRASFATDGQLGKAKEQGVGDGAVGVTGARVHNQPRRFVDHTQVCVVVHKDQGQLLGDESGRHRLWMVHHHPLSPPQLEAGATHSNVVDEDLSVVDERG